MVSVFAGVAVAPANAAPQQADALDALDAIGLLQPADIEGIAASGVLSKEGGLTVSSDGVGVSIRPVTAADPVLGPDKSTLTYAEASSHAFVLTGQGSAANAGYIVINDESAPDSYSFDISADGAAADLELVDGMVMIKDESGALVNGILRPWAVDADGVELPTWYSVEGTTLVQHVDTTGAAFPVVADPRLMCDLLFCTVEYTRSETTTIRNWGASATSLVSIACTWVATPLGGALCGLASATIIGTANEALSQGKCLGFRKFNYATVMFPVVVSCYA